MKEIGKRITVRDQPGKKHKTLSGKKLKQKVLGNWFKW
jgi:hypothetical protein